LHNVFPRVPRISTTLVQRPIKHHILPHCSIFRVLGIIGSEDWHPYPQDLTTSGADMPEETLYSVFKQNASRLKTAKQETDKLKPINSTRQVELVIQVYLSRLDFC
jgi:hypothetical protein